MKRNIYGILLSSSIALTGCSNSVIGALFTDGSGDKLTPITVHNDSQGNVMQVSTQLTQDNATEVLKSRLASNENQGYFMAQQALYSNPNLDGKDFAIISMAQALGGNKTMPTNSNDVKIAEMNANVAKHQTWAGVTQGLGYAFIGGRAAIKTVEAFADLAGAAGTVINNTGDGNDLDVTQNDVDQRADNGSTISDSGNLDQAKGIPLNAGDLAPVALGTPAPEEPQADIDGSGCTCPPGLTPRPDDPSFCSDGQGGGEPASCPATEESVTEEE